MWWALGDAPLQHQRTPGDQGFAPFSCCERPQVCVWITWCLVYAIGLPPSSMDGTGTAGVVGSQALQPRQFGCAVQDAEQLIEALRAHVEREFARLGSSNSAGVRVKSVGDWWEADPESKLFKMAERALTREWGRQPLFVREGGTMPVRPLPHLLLLTRVAGSAPTYRTPHTACGRYHAHMNPLLYTLLLPRVAGSAPTYRTLHITWGG